MQKKFLVLLAGLLVMASLVVIVSCAPAPAAPVKETVVVPQTVIVPQTVVAPAAAQPTAAPAATAAPKPMPPVATLKIVPVAATALDPNVITATLGATTTVYLGASGLNNVSIGVPVHLSAVVADAKNPAKKFAWTLTAPTGSKSALKDPAAANTEFTPDVVGMYKVDVVPSNDAGAGALSSVQIHADTYIGVTAGNCKQCHPEKFAEWSKTGHATKFTREIDGGSAPATSHYAETCIECHTTGYYPGAKNGGFADVQAKTGWKFPSLASIQSGTAGNWNAVPADLKNVANIQCEVCHGPANEHVTKGANVMAVSMDAGVCDVCHAVPTHHTKGNELANSKHSDKTETAWNLPTGPAEQDCVRCHSGIGYITFLANPTNKAAWNNTPQTPSCATCHDPHNDTNKFQLRVVGKPVQLPFDAKDAGLSATCEECHNGRQVPADALKGQFPHYSSIAEMMNGAAGVTYGQTLPDSPHGMIVGAAPIPDPTDKTGKTMLYGGVAPGPCVTCHMQPILADAKDPNVYKMGGHSFNMASPDGTVDYTAVCKTCHGDVKDFNFKAKADYDGNGKVEGVQDEVKGLLNVLWKALADKGLKKTDAGYPYATLPKDASGNTDPKILNAWYNFRVVYGVMWGTGADGKPSLGNQGAAQAIHNFKRSVSLLQLSYKDLTGQDVPNATLLYK